MKFKQEQVSFKPVTITLETMVECLWLRDVLDNDIVYKDEKEAFLNELHEKLATVKKNGE